MARQPSFQSQVIRHQPSFLRRCAARCRALSGTVQCGVPGCRWRRGVDRHAPESVMRQMLILRFCSDWQYSHRSAMARRPSFSSLVIRHQPTFMRRCTARCHSLNDTVQDRQDRQNQRPLEVEPEAVVYNTTLHVLQYRALLHCFTLFFFLSLVSSLPSHPVLPLSDVQYPPKLIQLTRQLKRPLPGPGQPLADPEAADAEEADPMEPEVVENLSEYRYIIIITSK